MRSLALLVVFLVAATVTQACGFLYPNDDAEACIADNGNNTWVGDDDCETPPAPTPEQYCAYENGAWDAAVSQCQLASVADAGATD